MSDHKQILVVEDDQAICEMITEFLYDEGYDAICADSGTEALQLLSNSSRIFNLITLDLGLPDMSGNDVLSQMSQGSLASSYGSTPVVVVSANPSHLKPDPRVKAVIPKPFNLVDLVNVIQQSLV
jgi:CheY-like chemotaxis protein